MLTKNYVMPNQTLVGLYPLFATMQKDQKNKNRSTAISFVEEVQFFMLCLNRVG